MSITYAAWLCDYDGVDGYGHLLLNHKLSAKSREKVRDGDCPICSSAIRQVWVDEVSE